MQDKPGETAEYRLWVRLRMTPGERAAYRAEHAMTVDEPTRKRLSRSVEIELEGLGGESGWWHDVRVT